MTVREIRASKTTRVARVPRYEPSTVQSRSAHFSSVTRDPVVTSLLWLFWAWQIRHKALTVSGLAVYLTEPAETDILLHKLTGRGVQELGDAFEQLPAFEPHGREYILQVGPSPHSSVSFSLHSLRVIFNL